MAEQQTKYLVSACLIGLCTRYDGALKENQDCLDFFQDKNCIPICPEQLGGLPTPREAADIHGGDGTDVLEGRARVLTKSGADLTDAFIKGAEQVLKAAQLLHINRAILKARSPSCAVSGVRGVTAALLAQNGIKLIEY
jgi:uncharacterized protein YbbK (DUF523 family)